MSTISHCDAGLSNQPGWLDTTRPPPRPPGRQSRLRNRHHESHHQRFPARHRSRRPVAAPQPRLRCRRRRDAGGGDGGHRYGVQHRRCLAAQAAEFPVSRPLGHRVRGALRSAFGARGVAAVSCLPRLEGAEPILCFCLGRLLPWRDREDPDGCAIGGWPRSHAGFLPDPWCPSLPGPDVESVGRWRPANGCSEPWLLASLSWRLSCGGRVLPSRSAMCLTWSWG